MNNYVITSLVYLDYIVFRKLLFRSALSFPSICAFPELSGIRRNQLIATRLL